MTDQRYAAHATIRPGECEGLIDRVRLQLVRVVLTDGGPAVVPDGTEHRRPDVTCLLRPAEARQLADQLLELAAQAEETSTR